MIVEMLVKAHQYRSAVIPKPKLRLTTHQSSAEGHAGDCQSVKFIGPGSKLWIRRQRRDIAGHVQLPTTYLSRDIADAGKGGNALCAEGKLVKATGKQHRNPAVNHGKSH